MHLDTHVVLWLYAGRVDLLSDSATAAVEGRECAVSPMVVLELHFLNEIGRVVDHASAIMSSLAAALGLRVAEYSFGSVVEHARGLEWTRDPFDRLITAQARAVDAPLVTRDRSIRANYSEAIW